MQRLALTLVISTVSCFAQSVNFQWVQTLGGSSSAAVAGMVTDAQGNSYVAGNTTSVDMAVRNAAQAHPAGSGLYRIDGAGSNWTNLYNSGASAVTALAASVQHPQTAFAVSPQGVLRTADGGATWQVNFPAGTTGPFAPGITSIAVDPTNDVLVYAVGTFGFITSKDGGITWKYGASFGFPNPDHHIWVDANQPQVIFSSSGGNLLRSGDRAASDWQTIPSSTGPVSMAFDPFVKGTIYAATQTVLQVSTDEGVTWKPLGQLDPSSKAQFILADPLHQGTLYATSVGGVFRSVDSGASWIHLTNSSAGPMAADPVSGAIYIWIDGTVFKTTDGLATRTAVGPPSPQTAAALTVAGASLYVGVAATTDIFVTKLDAQGNTIYSTYFGGTGSDVAHGLAVDPLGAAYVTGITNSPDFPVTAGAFAKTGGSFLFKLNPDGSTAYSTYFSDAQSEPNAVAVDSAGYAYIAGTTRGNLPVTPGVYQGALLGTVAAGTSVGPAPLPPTNGFIAEFNKDGGSLAYSTYFGNQNVTATALALQSDGTAIVAGGATLYHMYFGGLSLIDTAVVAGTVYAVAVDSANSVYAAGGTGPELFRGTPGAFQTAPVAIPAFPGALGNSGAGDAFLSKFDFRLRPISSTLLSGEAQDQAQAVALSANGNVILGGSTHSMAFPTRGAAQSSFSGSTSFVAGLTADLSTLQFSTYEGDARTFSILSIAAMPDGGAIFAGSTLGPIDRSSAIDPTVPNASQALVVRLTNAAQTGLRIDSVVNAASHLGVALSAGETFAVTGAGFASDATLLLNGAALPVIVRTSSTMIAAAPADFTSAAAATVTVQSGGGNASIVVPFANGAPGLFSVDGSGLGQGYILNADGTLNSASNPALEGSKVTIFATGVGPMTFVGPFAVTNLPVEILIDGLLAPGIAAVSGPVAGLPGNVYQISVSVPQPYLLAHQNPAYLDVHLPAQSALTLVMSPNAVFSNGILVTTIGISQAGLGISISH